MYEYFLKYGFCQTLKRIVAKLIFILKVRLGLIKTRKDFIHHLKGSGLEIGALHGGLAVDTSMATVKYIDILPLEGLLQRYPELQGLTLQSPDYVGTLENLSDITDESQDFFIANHVLEHVRNPILGLQEIYRILKKDGTVFLTLPEKTRTFDAGRYITPVEHMVQDFMSPDVDRDFYHFLEYVNIENNSVYTEQIQKAKHLQKEEYPIHFHTFVYENAIDLIKVGNELGYFNFQCIDSKKIDKNQCDAEFILILRKT